jgi:sulfide:quinone oxidoreductase
MNGLSRTRHQVVIVGGGAAGLTVAASLLRKAPALDVVIVEPSEDHWYQPAFTLVGAGVYPLARTRREEADLMPRGAKWLKAAAEGFAPAANEVHLADGRVLVYDQLVVCPGIALDWNQVEGLAETLGRNEVCSNYSPQFAPYTWVCLQKFSGGAALFTQPPAPFKCAGAPQKIAYLAADHWRGRGLLDKASLALHIAGASIFAVPYFTQPLSAIAEGYGIRVSCQSNLVAVDGERKIATFAETAGDGSLTRIEKPFDLLHVTPPQSAPAFIKTSPLANAAGWVDVDEGTMEHKAFPGIFSLGDAGSTPNSKTAAAVRKQAPVVVKNLLARLAGGAPTARYDGYASCPLTTEYGKVLMAEFCYGGKVTPTFPLDPAVPRKLYWALKVHGLEYLYWDIMLNGYEIDIPHRPWKAAA